MKTRLIAMMMVALTCVTAMQGATYYGFKIGGVSVTSDNYRNVTGSNIKAGTVTYDPSTNEVTLTNVTISRSGSDNRAIYNESCNYLKVVFKGTCELAAADAAPVRIEDTTTFFASSGSKVIITGKDEDAIYIANSCTLHIDGEETSAYAITASNSRAIARESGCNARISFGANSTSTIYGSKGCIVDMPYFIVTGESDLTLQGNTGGYAVVTANDYTTGGKHYAISPAGADYSPVLKTFVINGMANNVITSQTLRITYAIPITSGYFRDANLRSYLKSQSYGTDGYLTKPEIAEITTLNVAGRSNIRSLNGVEQLTSLKSIYAYSCRIDTLTVSLPELTTLSVANNEMKVLDCSKCTNLESLYCQNNQLKSLNYSGSKLSTVYCFKNQLSTLQLICPELKNLQCEENGMTQLWLNYNTKLEYLDCSNNQLREMFGLGAATKLKTLYAQNNKLNRTVSVVDCPTLETMDVSGNPDLPTLQLNNAANTKLRELKVYNTGLCSNATRLNNFIGIQLTWRTDSPKVYVMDQDDSNEQSLMTPVRAVEIIAKGWVPYYRKNGEWIAYEDGVAINSTNFPDEIFRSYLQSQSYGADDLLTRAEIESIKQLNVNRKGIKNLKGVEFLTGLAVLQCNDNLLESLDVRQNSKLGVLMCHTNSLTSLNLLSNQTLQRLDCSSNRISTLNLSANTRLTQLSCSNNMIKGEGLEQMIAQMPTVSARKINYFRDNESMGYAENNDNLSVAQVKELMTKGWTPCYYAFDTSEWVEYATYVPGDVNGDDNVDVADVVALASYTMGDVPEGTFVVEAANINGDDEINVSDVVALANQVMGE